MPSPSVDLPWHFYISGNVPNVKVALPRFLFGLWVMGAARNVGSSREHRL
jgi:hypothetical protein